MKHSVMWLAGALLLLAVVLVVFGNSRERFQATTRSQGGDKSCYTRAIQNARDTGEWVDLMWSGGCGDLQNKIQSMCGEDDVECIHRYGYDQNWIFRIYSEW